MKELSEAFWSRINLSREGFRPGGQGAGGGGVHQWVRVHWMVRGHHAVGPPGLRRGGGWSEGLSPPGTRETCAQAQTLPAGGWDSVPPSAPKVWVTSPPFPDTSHFS